MLIRAGSVPKTSSGKIQRHACRDGYLAGTLDVVGQWRAADAPRGRRAARRRRKPAPRSRRKRVLRPSPRAGRRRTARTASAARSNDRLTQLVVEEIRRVAKERADGMTLDSPIVETGMDSLERMEILASLEEKFGGRFPEEILPDLETTRQVVAAVEKYLGTEPRPPQCPLRRRRNSAGRLPLRPVPGVREAAGEPRHARSLGLGEPVLRGPRRPDHRPDDHRRPRADQFFQLQLPGDVGRSGRSARPPRRRSTATAPARRPAGWCRARRAIHVELERAITRFLGTEDTIALVGGHATNETVIGHLMGPGDLILHDALAHNSIVQGCILSGARRRPFAHNDWQAADRLLAQFRHEYRRVLMAIEGVYSMDGDIPDLPRFVEVKKRHQALLMIDEAHSMGVLGATGRGIGEHFGVDRGDVDIWMGTFSKSFGSCGGYIAGCKALVEYLRYTAPGFVFAAAMPPPAAAAALAALRLLEAEPQRVARLRENARLFLALAQQHGLNTGTSKDSPVVPVILGNSIHCLKLSKAMFARGVNVQPILHPAVEESASRLRYFITARHNEQQLRYTIDAMVEELEKIDASHLAHAHSGAAVTD